MSTMLRIFSSPADSRAPNPSPPPQKVQGRERKPVGAETAPLLGQNVYKGRHAPIASADQNPRA